MIRGLPASIVFHAAVLGLGYVSWPFLSATTGFESESILVPIELVDIGALNNIAPVLRPEPEPEEEIVPEVAEEEPEEVPEDEPEPVDETLPEDEIDTASEQETPEEVTPEEVVPDFEATPEETEDPEPEPETPKPVVQEPDLLDDLLNEADSTFVSQRQTRRDRETPEPVIQPLLEDTPPTPQEVRRGAGERTANTARLESLLYNQIYNCWDGVDDQPNSETLNVRMSIELDDNGYLMGRINMIEPSRDPVGRSPMRVAVERARRAVQRCAPYNLPKQEYAEWREININLGPAFEPTKK